MDEDLLYWLTKVGWEVKKAIWIRWSLGDKDADILRYLEHNQDKYPSVPFHRDTIRKVRAELATIDVGTARTLIHEVPNIKEFVIRQRPDLKEALELILEAKGSETEVPQTYEHRQQMTEIAKLFTAAQSDVTKEGLLDESKLSEQLDSVLKSAKLKFGQRATGCFWSHINAALQVAERQGKQRNGELMLNVIKDLARGEDLRGRCEICKDW